MYDKPEPDPRPKKIKPDPPLAENIPIFYLTLIFSAHTIVYFSRHFSLFRVVQLHLRPLPLLFLDLTIWCQRTFFTIVEQGCQMVYFQNPNYQFGVNFLVPLGRLENVYIFNG
jgi:hypothetical protein